MSAQAPNATAPPRSGNLYARLLVEARPYWGRIAGLFLVALLSTPLALLAPLPLKLIADNALGGAPLPAAFAALLPAHMESGRGLLLAVALLVVLVALLTRLQSSASSIGQTWIGQQLVLDFRTRLFSHLQHLSLRYHDRVGSHDSTYRVQYDTGSIESVAIQGVIPFVTSLVQLVSMVWVTALLSPELAVVAIAVSPILLYLTHVYRSPLRRRWRSVKQLESDAMSVVQESLSAVHVVKAFGQEQREHDRYAAQAGASLRAQLSAIVFESGFSVLVGLTVAAGTAAVLFIGAGQVQAGELSLGDLLLVIGYVANIYDPLKTIGRKFATLQKALASAERVYAVLDADPDVVERPDARPLLRARGDLRFEQVAFGYSEHALVLDDVSLDVPAGSRVGITGRTGAGKSTFLSLLPRFYDPLAGRILLDGVDLRDIRLADLRHQYSIVLQEPLLFSTTIADNIAFGRPDATQAQIEAAASAAGAHAFILELEDGYLTQVGERGLRLSGGERQRIAIARAFLKDAPVLILDEPTSSVDVKTELGIFEALERLMEGRTTFVIAHRIDTLAGCDLHVRLAHGRLRVVSRDEVAQLAVQGDDA